MKKIYIFLIATAVFNPLSASAAPILLKDLRELTDRQFTDLGKAALSMNPTLWKHAETDHFIYHLTDTKSAETVYAYAEVYYQWVRDLLGSKPDSSTKKAHVYIFEKKEDWHRFLTKTGDPSQRAAFTTGWDLFIYRDPFWLSPMRTMAHEMTHVILFRFLDGPIPLFVNEGLAEFVSFRAVAMQLGRSEFDIRTLQRIKNTEYIPLKNLAAMAVYPAKQEEVEIYYRESEWFIRYLILKQPAPFFKDFLDAVSHGKPAIKTLEDLSQIPFENWEKAFKAYAVSP
jgi:hypothetical protein